MVQIDIYRDRGGQITSFSVDGHAGYAPKGEDIVCAAVSVLSFGTINALKALLDVPLSIRQDEESGFLHCVVSPLSDEEREEKAQLLLEAMLLSMESIAKEYGRHIKLRIHHDN